MPTSKHQWVKEIDDRRPDTVWEVHWDFPDGQFGKVEVIGYDQRQAVYRSLSRNGAKVLFKRVSSGSNPRKAQQARSKDHHGGTGDLFGKAKNNPIPTD